MTALSLDVLTLLDTLAQGFTKRHSARELGSVTVFVVDEEDLGLGGGSGNFDNISLLRIRTLVQHVHESLLLGWWHHHRSDSTVTVVGAHENVVQVDFRIGEVCGWQGLKLDGWSSVQEEIPRYLWGDTASVMSSDLSTTASIPEPEVETTTTTTSSM